MTMTPEEFVKSNCLELTNLIEKIRNGIPVPVEPDVPVWANKDNPAEGLINTALAMNNDWDLVALPRFKRFKSLYSNTKSVNDLAELIAGYNGDEIRFCKDVLNLNVHTTPFWRYHMLVDLVKMFQQINIHKWANTCDLKDINRNVVYKIPYVKLATIQNLRICLGVNTLKPDVHVKNAVRKMGYPVSKYKKKEDLEVLRFCEALPKITGYSLYQIDWILWKGEKDGWI